jgi:hypothetical protein
MMTKFRFTLPELHILISLISRLRGRATIARVHITHPDS